MTAAKIEVQKGIMWIAVSTSFPKIKELRSYRLHLLTSYLSFSIFAFPISNPTLPLEPYLLTYPWSLVHACYTRSYLSGRGFVVLSIDSRTTYKTNESYSLLSTLTLPDGSTDISHRWTPLSATGLDRDMT